MRNLLTFLIAAILTINSTFSYASDCPSSIDLKVGDKVTDCNRVGLNEETAKEVQMELVEKDYLEKELKETQKQIQLKDLMISSQEKHIELWKSDALRERKALDEQRQSTQYSFWIGMGIGALAILAGAYSVKQVAR